MAKPMKPSDDYWPNIFRCHPVASNWFPDKRGGSSDFASPEPPRFALISRPGTRSPMASPTRSPRHRGPGTSRRGHRVPTTARWDASAPSAGRSPHPGPNASREHPAAARGGHADRPAVAAAGPDASPADGCAGHRRRDDRVHDRDRCRHCDYRGDHCHRDRCGHRDRPVHPVHGPVPRDHSSAQAGMAGLRRRFRHSCSTHRGPDWRRSPILPPIARTCSTALTLHSSILCRGQIMSHGNVHTRYRRSRQSVT